MAAKIGFNQFILMAIIPPLGVAFLGYNLANAIFGATMVIFLYFIHSFIYLFFFFFFPHFDFSKPIFIISSKNIIECCKCCGSPTPLSKTPLGCTRNICPQTQQ